MENYLGSSQIKQAWSYYEEHIRNDGKYVIEVCRETYSDLQSALSASNTTWLLRGRIKSRHISNKKYFTYILVDRALIVMLGWLVCLFEAVIYSRTGVYFKGVIMPTLKRCLKRKIAEVLGETLSTAQPQPSGSQKNNCAFCNYKKRRMTKFFCTQCKKFMCMDHRGMLCVDCTE
ncbi:hypothetical protein evm_014191 [Chilo suppressalis]|nr:hypothetical protein evm_014191 [Chilo suppressalis]